MNSQLSPAVLLDTPQGTYPLRYSIEQIPDQADAQVSAMINRMCQYVCQDSTSYPIAADAESAIAIDPSNPLAAVHSFVRSRMEFCRDETLAAPFTGKLPQDGNHYFVEAITRPVDISLQYAATGEKVKGDCDCHCGYCAALLRNLGIECAFATVSDADPRIFEHVYVVAYWRGKRVPMDCSHGQYAGWEKRNQGDRYMEWPITDRAGWGAVAMGMLLAGYAAYRWSKA